MVRVVRVAPDLAEVDTSRKKNGRGSYLCPAQECWALAEKKKSLNHALEMTVSVDNWKSLWSYAQGLPEKKVLKRAEREALVATPAAGGDRTWDEPGSNRLEAAQPFKSPPGVGQ